MMKWPVRPPKVPGSGLYCVRDGFAQVLGGGACAICQHTIFVTSLVYVEWAVCLTGADYVFLRELKIEAI